MTANISSQELETRKCDLCKVTVPVYLINLPDRCCDRKCPLNAVARQINPATFVNSENRGGF